MQLITALVIAILFTVSGVASARSWVYYDIREPRNQFLLESNPPRSAWMDIAESAEFCGRSDPYICFRAGEFQFAIPKKFNGREDEWTYNGVSYKITGVTRRPILGRLYRTYFIERNLGDHRLRFHYSRESGLIAITTVGATQGMFLILSGNCGYGAPPTCYKPN